MLRGSFVAPAPKWSSPGTADLSPRCSDESSRWHQMGGDRCVVAPPDVYGGAFGPIVRPVASAATASRKLAGGVRCAH